MDNFDIILVLARTALDQDSTRAQQQIERLKNILEKTDKDQAAKLGRLLTRNDRRSIMTPMALEEMRSASQAAKQQLPGETLSKSTPFPTDKETGAPLVRITFPSDLHEPPPILDLALSQAIDDLLNEWNKIDDLARIGAKPNTRCLLYGAPGVGKTRLARRIALRLDLPLVEARLDGLVSSFLGTTARNIGTLFDFANRYRCVLFLDEFDAIAKARDDAQEVGEIKRVVNTLLQSLDSRIGKGFTIAATNHEHLLDQAVWRRFEARIHIPKPNSDVRAQILKMYLNPINLEEHELRFLVYITEGMSGSDLEILVNAGKRYFVLNNGNNTTNKKTLVLEALKREALLNANLFQEEYQKLLLGTEDILTQSLRASGFNQREIGELLGKSQSSISRKQKLNFTPA